ncbi:hypothetical protein D3C77_252650 [compost metagenome]
MTLFTMLHRLYAIFHSGRINRVWWLGSGLAIAANSAFAADCDIRLSSTEVNYGELNRAQKAIGQGRSPIALGRRQLTLTALCRQATTIELRFNGDAADMDSYRLAGKGRFTVRVHNATLDGNPVQLIRATSFANSRTEASVTAELRPNEAAVAVARGQQVVGQIFSAQVEIEAFIDEAMIRTRDITLLEGRGAIILNTQ